MRQIELKICTINSGSRFVGAELNYKKEYLQILEMAPEGITVPEMARLIRVIDRLQKAPEVGSVSLEDADWETLKARVEAAKFQVVASEIVEMVENVTNAKSVTE